MEANANSVARCLRGGDTGHAPHVLMYLSNTVCPVLMPITLFCVVELPMNRNVVFMHLSLLPVRS
jgi:hypothetical protein